MIYVRGFRSEIAKALSTLTEIAPVKRFDPMPDDGEKYLFCAGVIHQRPLSELLPEEIATTFEVNTSQVIVECERLLSVNPRARICVMGSESGFKGSFDPIYAAAKAGLHRYVETKRLKFPGQQLVAVAPTCILHTGMNERRNEDGKAALERRLLTHPKGRWLEPIEVAQMIHFLLCVDQGYTTNLVVRMNGGEHCVS